MAINLDVKDRRILYELDLNARMGTSELGKRVGVSQEAAYYRIRRLEGRSVISGYTTLVNFAKLGYTGYGVYTRFQNVTKEQRTKIVEELKGYQYIYWIGEFGGKYDLAFAIMARNIIHFNEMFTEIMTKYTEVLKDFTVAIRVELVQSPRDYLLEKQRVTEKLPSFGKYIEAIELDDMDRSVLNGISDNARISTLELAKKCRYPASTVSTRLKRLEKSGIIQGYSTLMHCQEFGYQSFQLFITAHNLTKERKSRLLAYCNTHANIVFYIETVGKWNFEIIYEVENQKVFQDLVIEFRTMFSDIILDVESIMLFNHYVKYNQYPLK